MIGHCSFWIKNPSYISSIFCHLLIRFDFLKFGIDENRKHGPLTGLLAFCVLFIFCNTLIAKTD